MEFSRITSAGPSSKIFEFVAPTFDDNSPFNTSSSIQTNALTIDGLSSSLGNLKISKTTKMISNVKSTEELNHEVECCKKEKEDIFDFSSVENFDSIATNSTFTLLAKLLLIKPNIKFIFPTNKAYENFGNLLENEMGQMKSAISYYKKGYKRFDSYSEEKHLKIVNLYLSLNMLEKALKAANRGFELNKSEKCCKVIKDIKTSLESKKPKTNLHHTVTIEDESTQSVYRTKGK